MEILSLVIYGSCAVLVVIILYRMLEILHDTASSVVNNLRNISSDLTELRRIREIGERELAARKKDENGD